MTHLPPSWWTYTSQVTLFIIEIRRLGGVSEQTSVDNFGFPRPQLNLASPMLSTHMDYVQLTCGKSVVHSRPDTTIRQKTTIQSLGLLRDTEEDNQNDRDI